MKTKQILLILSVLFLTVNFTFLNAQWKPCTNDYCNGIFTLMENNNNIYAGTDGCGVLMSTDNGDNWIPINNGLKGSFGLDVSSLAMNKDTIFACTLSDGIFRSTDKGVHWVRKSKGFPFTAIVNDSIFSTLFMSIIFKNNDIILGTNIGVFLSIDNGENWIPKKNGLYAPDTLSYGINSFIINGNNIFVAAARGIYKSTDNGENWLKKDNGITDSIVFILSISGDNLYAGTWSDGIFLSTDDGSNWKYMGLKDTTINVIKTIGNFVFASGCNINFSSDNGNSWIKKNSGLPDDCIKSYAINDTYVFAATRDYGVYRAKLSDLGITNVKETNQNNETLIYPNPASSSVKMKYESKSYSKLQISIFDLLGNEVFNSSEECNIGMNEKTIDCHSLETGYYIIRLKQGERVSVKPLVLLK